MLVFVLSLIIVGLSMAGLAAGLLIGRAPLRGVCGPCGKSGSCAACKSQQHSASAS